MEHYDTELAQRVWQRVRGEATGAQGSTKAFLLAEWEVLALCGQLSRLFPRRKRLWQQLAGDTQRHIACLRGILYLTEGHRGSELPIKPRQEQPDALLRRYCANCLKLASDYRACAEDPEYGCMYAALAEKKQAHYTLLLESIGNMGK